MTNEKHTIVLPLLAIAVSSLGFLWGVAYTNASFQGTERPVPQVLTLRQISPRLDSAMQIIVANAIWSSQVAVDTMRDQSLAFLGIDQSLFDTNPSVYAIAQHRGISTAEGAVLGASHVNPTLEQSQ